MGNKLKWQVEKKLISQLTSPQYNPTFNLPGASRGQLTAGSFAGSVRLGALETWS